MTALTPLIRAVLFRAQRLGGFLRSIYWAAQIRAQGGKVGSGFSVRAGAALDLGRGAKIEIGERVTLAEGTRVYIGPGAVFTVGNGVFIGRGSTIASNLEVTIGEGSQIAHFVTIIDTDHKFGAEGVALDRQGQESAPIRVGANVWVGAQAVILKGKTIGARAVVGAGSIVTHDVPENGVVAGNPARPLPQGGAKK